MTISISEAGGQLTPPSVVLSAQPNGVLQTQTTWSLNPGPVLATSSFLPPQPHFTNTPTNQTWASSWNPQTGAYMSNQHFPQVPWMTTGMTASSWPSVHSMPQPASTCKVFQLILSQLQGSSVQVQVSPPPFQQFQMQPLQVPVTISAPPPSAPVHQPSPSVVQHNMSTTSPGENTTTPVQPSGMPPDQQNRIPPILPGVLPNSFIIFQVRFTLEFLIMLGRPLRIRYGLTLT